MSESEYECGNCDEDYSIDSDGDRIQNCPECGSPEMVKKPNGKDIATK